MSRITLTILAAAGITLFSGVLFHMGGLSSPAAILSSPTTDTASPAKTSTYTNPTFGFSFDDPETISVDVQPSSDGYLAIATEPATGRSFQVFITPIRSDVKLTEDLIRAQIPQTILGDVERVTIGNSLPGFRFTAADPDVGQTLEILFLDGLGDLYQLTTYPNAGDWLDGMLKTWRIDPPQ